MEQMLLKYVKVKLSIKKCLKTLIALQSVNDQLFWKNIPDHPYKILIIGGSRSGKANALINLINEQNDIEKIYLYARDLSEPKY